MKRVLSSFLAFALVVGVFVCLPVTVNSASASSGFLTFELNDNGLGYVLTDCNTKMSGEIDVPANYNNLPVTEIANNAFSLCNKLTQINIPSTITKIGYNVFYNCTSLQNVNVDVANEYYCSVDGVLFDRGKSFFGEYELLLYPSGKVENSYTVPTNVHKIGDSAFGFSENLSEVVITKNVSIINSKFSNIGSLQKFSVDDENECFSDMDGVLFDKSQTWLVSYPCNKIDEYYVIPDTVKCIDLYAFSRCKNLKELVISKNVESLDYAFGSDNSICNIIVDDDNPSFCSVEGVLFSKDTKKLIRYPDNKPSVYYEIPANVEEIKKDAFSYASNLQMVYIPATVRQIDDFVFDVNKIIIKCEKDSYAYNYAESHDIEYEIKNTSCTDFLIFELDAIKNEYWVKGIEPSSGYVDIVVPEIYKGLPVTGVASSLFLNSPIVKTVSIPKSVSHIDETAFIFAENLEEIYVDVNNKMFSSIDGVLFNKKCTEILHYPAKNKRKAYSIPNTVSIIKSDDFVLCNNLTSITIPASVNFIDEYAFRYCPELSKIIVNESNKNYSSDNGVLFNKNKTKLIQYPLGKSVEVYNIPETVSQVDLYAFWGASKLKKLSTNKIISEDMLSSAIADSLLVGVKGNKVLSDLEKAMLLYDRLTIHSSYDYFALTNQNAYTHAHSEFGAFVKGLCVCDGYSKAYNHLLNKVGIKSEMVTSKKMDHGWNLLYIDNKAYYADVTFGDDSLNNNLTHENFLCTQKEFNETHKADDYGSIQNNPSYSSAPWRENCSASCLLNGKVYYSARNSLYCLSDENSIVLKNVRGLTTDDQKLYFLRFYDTEWDATDFSDIITVTLCSYQPNNNQLQNIYTFKCNNAILNQVKLNYISGNIVIELIDPYNDENKIVIYECTSIDDDKVLELPLTPTVAQKNTAKGIQVSWNAITNAESYIVYRSVYSGGKWSSWGAIKKGVTTTSYVDTTVKLGTKYKYTVRAVNGSVMSSYQNTKNGLTYNVTPTVKVALASNGIKVAWSTAANATGYTVYRSEYNTKTKSWTKWANRGTAKANKTSWTDTKVKSGTQYKYTVRAVNGKVASSYNTTGAATLFLSQPTVKIANNANGVKVAWSKVTGAKGYTVYRSEFSKGKWTGWKNMGTAKSDKSSWVDKSVVSGVQYKYTVRAINGKVASTYVASNILLYLAQPTTAVKAVSNGINVAWTQSAGAEGYTVYRSEYNTKTKKWSGWKKMGTAKPDKTNWTDKSAKKGVTYKYTTKAVSGSYASTYAASGNVKR